MKTLTKTVCGVAAAAALSVASMPAQAAAITPEAAISSSTGYAPLASLPTGPGGPAIKEHKVKLLKVARRRGRRWRRRRARIGAGIGAAIVGGIILNEVARSNRYYYDEPAYYYGGPRYRGPVYSCRALKYRCKRGIRRACYRWDYRCS